jgi:hypothetical protein
MDDEDLANLLRSSTNPGLPGFYSNTNSTTLTPAANAVDDPFANPFANPFASDNNAYQASGSGFGNGTTQLNIKDDSEDVSPYVTKLREEGVVENSYGFKSEPSNPYATSAVDVGGFNDDPCELEPVFFCPGSGFAYLRDLLNNSDSGGFDRNPILPNTNRGGFDSPGFGTNNDTVPDPFGSTSNYANEFAPLQDPFRVTELDDPYSTNRLPYSPPSGSTKRNPTSPARVRPSSDILGLLGEEEDTSASLKKAFVASDARPKAHEDKSKSPSGSPRPYVFKPGGNASRKKVGITFDSVQKERERKEQEQKARIEEEKKREIERLKQEELSKPKSPSSQVESASHDETENVTDTTEVGRKSAQSLEQDALSSGNSILERAAREAASPSPPGPSVSATVAAQILESANPEIAAERVAESMAQQKMIESVQTTSVKQEGDVTPSQVPLPPSRAATPLTGLAAQVSPSDQTGTIGRDQDTTQYHAEPSPLDDEHTKAEQVYPALAVGGSSYEQEIRTEDVSASTEQVHKNKGWGRAFEESEDGGLDNSREFSTPLAHEPLGWTTEVNEPYVSANPMSPVGQEPSWSGSHPQRPLDEPAVDQDSRTSGEHSQVSHLIQQYTNAMSQPLIIREPCSYLVATDMVT